jgi:membrane protein DedA with SNARE-associated domain
LFQALAEYAQQIIAQIGYPGILILMALESTMVPIPSELVMPFAGFLALKGVFSLPLVIAMNTCGAIIGSLGCYYIGSWGGKPLIDRYGKYLFVNQHDLEKTQTFFARHGSATVFVARLIPVVRHFISLVAGLAKMSLWKFLLQTVLGATLWGGFLAVLGYELGPKWEAMAKSVKHIDLFIGLGVIGVGVIFFLRHRSRVLAARKTAAVDTRDKADSSAR